METMNVNKLRSNLFKIFHLEQVVKVIKLDIAYSSIPAFTVEQYLNP